MQKDTLIFSSAIFFPPTDSPGHIGNKGTVIPCPVYVSVTSQCCPSTKTHVMLHFVVWLYHHLAGKHSDYPSPVALNLACTRTKTYVER